MKVAVGGGFCPHSGKRQGPVNAMDGAAAKRCSFLPELEAVRLLDYKVRVVDQGAAPGREGAGPRESTDGAGTWHTMGCSANQSSSVLDALHDSWEWWLSEPRRPQRRSIHCRVHDPRNDDSPVRHRVGASRYVWRLLLLDEDVGPGTTGLSEVMSRGRTAPPKRTAKALRRCCEADAFLQLPRALHESATQADEACPSCQGARGSGEDGAHAVRMAASVHERCSAGCRCNSPSSHLAVDHVVIPVGLARSTLQARLH